MMVAIGGLHSASVEVIISPLGLGSTGSVTVKALAHFDLLPGSSLPEIVQTSATWPNERNASVEELAYNLLWTLDHEIGKVYKQESLWQQ